MAFSQEEAERLVRNGYSQQSISEYRKSGSIPGSFESIMSKDTGGFSYWLMIPEQVPIVKQYSTFDELANDVLPIPEKVDMKKEELDYFDKKFDEIPTDILERAVKCLKERLSEEDKKCIIESFNEYGKHEWMHHINNGRGHFSAGMGIRNLLRQNGLYDDYLPDKNWDDYYVPVIEKALNLR